MGILQARILEWVAMPSSRDLPNPRIKLRKPKITPDRIKSMQSQCKLLKGSRGENNSFHDGEWRKRKEEFSM